MNLRAMLITIRMALILFPAATSDLFGQDAANPNATGSVCVAPVEYGNNQMKSLANPAGGNEIKQYQVRINGGAPVVALAKKGQLVSGLDLDAKHNVRISGDGKQVASFAFS